VKLGFSHKGENGVLGETFGTKRDEVTEWWNLLNEELNNLQSLPNITEAFISRMVVGPHRTHDPPPPTQKKVLVPFMSKQIPPPKTGS
jgi:hypothetical protein